MTRGIKFGDEGIGTATVGWLHALDDREVQGAREASYVYVPTGVGRNRREIMGATPGQLTRETEDRIDH
jgi:hypothetical protein